VNFDRVIVPELDETAVEIVSIVLAQSVAMDYYDQDVEQMFERVTALSTQLAKAGSLGLGGRDLQRFVGRILVTRTQIAATLSLLDAPTSTWERESAERLHRAMRTTFEVADRYQTLQHKLGVIQDDLDIVVDLVNTRRSTLLELLVILLILLELILAAVGFFTRH
jgi:uncharacterized Rmd1/YagE family protein